jgi:hypothetical protein
MGNFSPLIEMRGHFEWLSHYLHISCELDGFRWMLVTKYLATTTVQLHHRFANKRHSEVR